MGRRERSNEEIQAKVARNGYKPGACQDSDCVKRIQPCGEKTAYDQNRTLAGYKEYVLTPCLTIRWRNINVINQVEKCILMDLHTSLGERRDHS